MVCEETIQSLVSLKMSSAVINEPTGKSETPLKFTAGLVLCIRLDAVIRNITNVRHVRVKIKYPDQQTHLVLPKLSDFRQLDAGSEGQSQVRNYRLYTNVYLSHAVWSEPCHVEVGISLDFRDTSSTALAVSQLWASRTGSYMGVKSKSDENLLLELCRPVRVYVAPKPHKKGVM
jgi:integrator complex subunit 4